jgi:hypothetical protein
MDDIEDNVPQAIDLPKEEPVEIRLDDEGKSSKKAEKKAAKEDDRSVKAENVQSDTDEREKQLIEIKRQYEEAKRREAAERQARQQAEEYAYHQAQQAQYAKADAQDNRLRTVLNAIEATERTAISAERDYADAMAAGDYAQAAKAQRIMAQAESHLLQLQNAKANVEDALESMQAEGRVQEPPRPRFAPQQPPQDPVEALSSRLTPKSAAWLRAHPEAANHVEKLSAIHQYAVNIKGIEAESPEYFKYVEKKLGIDQSDDYVPNKSSRKAMASAPVSSSSGMSSRSNGNGNTMILSPAEVEQALLNEPTLPKDKALEMYARNKAALIREGKLSA